MSMIDKTVIVTGAGQGIGEAYAKHCAAVGMNVAIAELNEQQGQRVADEIYNAGGKAIFVRTDVADENSTQAMAAATAEAFGGIDFLINNAAIFGEMKMASFLTVDINYLEKFYRVNINGCLLATRAVVPYMEARGGGAIINQTSTAAWMPISGFYGVAKLAVNGLTTALATELGHKKIRVNAIAPGPIDTAATQKQAGDYVKEIVKSIPISRVGQPDDLVGPALFLLSDDAKWITGQILNVDGGQVMRT